MALLLDPGRMRCRGMTTGRPWCRGARGAPAASVVPVVPVAPVVSVAPVAPVALARYVAGALSLNPARTARTRCPRRRGRRLRASASCRRCPDPGPPAASFSRLSASPASRSRAAASTRGAALLATTTTPSSSATTTSPGVDQLPGADDRHVHAAQCALDRAPGRNGARPHREPHVFEGAYVAYPGIGDQPPDAAGPWPRSRAGRRTCRRCCPRYRRGPARPGPAELDRHVDHPVVARLGQDGDGAAGGLRPRMDRADVRLEQAAAALGLVHGRDPSAPRWSMVAPSARSMLRTATGFMSFSSSVGDGLLLGAPIPGSQQVSGSGFAGSGAPAGTAGLHRCVAGLVAGPSPARPVQPGRVVHQHLPA